MQRRVLPLIGQIGGLGFVIIFFFARAGLPTHQPAGSSTEAEGMQTDVTFRQLLGAGRTSMLSPVSFPSYQGLDPDASPTGFEANSDNSDIDTGSD